MKQLHNVGKNEYEKQEDDNTSGKLQMKQKDNEMVHEGKGKRESEGNRVY